MGLDMLVVELMIGGCGVEALLGGLAGPAEGVRAVLIGLIGRPGIGRIVKGTEAGGRGGAAPVGPVGGFPGTLSDATGRTGTGRATEGPVLGGRAMIGPLSVGRGTTRFDLGGSMLEDDGDDNIVMGGSFGLALNGEFGSEGPAFGLPESDFFGDVLFESVALSFALAALAAASAASCSAFSSAALSRLR